MQEAENSLPKKFVTVFHLENWGPQLERLQAWKAFFYVTYIDLERFLRRLQLEKIDNLFSRKVASPGLLPSKIRIR